MWLKIGNNIFNSNSDIFMAICMHERKNREFADLKISTIFELLDADIGKYRNLGKVFLCRGLNARSGCEPDYILFDHYIEAGLNINIESADI